MKNIEGAVCIACGAEYEAGDRTYLCPKCGGVLEIVYDYPYIKKVFTREKLAGRRDPAIWRYRELLPIEEDSESSPCG
jgi:threonine synthase